MLSTSTTQFTKLKLKKKNEHSLLLCYSRLSIPLQSFNPISNEESPILNECHPLCYINSLY